MGTEFSSRPMQRARILAFPGSVGDVEKVKVAIMVTVGMVVVSVMVIALMVVVMMMIMVMVEDVVCSSHDNVKANSRRFSITLAVIKAK